MISIALSNRSTTRVCRKPASRPDTDEGSGPTSGEASSSLGFGHVAPRPSSARYVTRADTYTSIELLCRCLPCPLQALSLPPEPLSDQERFRLLRDACAVTDPDQRIVGRAFCGKIAVGCRISQYGSRRRTCLCTQYVSGGRATMCARCNCTLVEPSWRPPAGDDDLEPARERAPVNACSLETMLSFTCPPWDNQRCCASPRRGCSLGT